MTKVHTSDGDIVLDRVEHKYFHDGIYVPNVTTILKDEGFINYDRIPPHVRDFAMDRGSKTHRMTQLYDLGQLDEDTLDESLLGRLEAWKKFLHDTGFEIHSIESVRFSRKWWYVGTEDRSGVFRKWKPELNGKKVCLDIKGVVADWTALQTAGYALTRPDFSDWVRVGIQLQDDGNWRPRVFTDTHDFRIFLNAVQNHKWKRSHS